MSAFHPCQTFSCQLYDDSKRTLPGHRACLPYGVISTFDPETPGTLAALFIVLGGWSRCVAPRPAVALADRAAGTVYQFDSRKLPFIGSKMVRALSKLWLRPRIRRGWSVVASLANRLLATTFLKMAGRELIYGYFAIARHEAMTLSMEKLATRAITAALSLTVCGPLLARTPTRGAIERQAIFDAMRPAIEAKIGPDVEFVVYGFAC